jgi:hypothetical protein
MATKARNGLVAPDGSEYVSLTDGAGATPRYGAQVSITRPNDTAAYAAADVIGAATGSTAAVVLAIGPVTGGEVQVISTALEIDLTSVPASQTSFRLYLYNVTPPSALGDNAAWDLPAGDRPGFIGYLDLGTPVDLGSTLYVEVNNIWKQITVPTGGNIYGLLTTTAGHTPVAQTVYKMTIHTTAQ